MSAASEVAAFFRSLGLTVYSFGDKRHARYATAGIPDLYVVSPRIGAFWFEAKRGSDKQRPEQRKFEKTVRAAGVPYVLGDLLEAQAWLRARGIVK